MFESFTYGSYFPFSAWKSVSKSRDRYWPSFLRWFEKNMNNRGMIVDETPSWKNGGIELHRLKVNHSFRYSNFEIGYCVFIWPVFGGLLRTIGS